MELDGARYLNFNLPFSISQLVWIEAILVGGAEIYRNRELDPETRIYPGAALWPGCEAKPASAFCCGYPFPPCSWLVVLVARSCAVSWPPTLLGR